MNKYILVLSLFGCSSLVPEEKKDPTLCILLFKHSGMFDRVVKILDQIKDGVDKEIASSLLVSGYIAQCMEAGDPDAK